MIGGMLILIEKYFFNTMLQLKLSGYSLVDEMFYKRIFNLKVRKTSIKRLKNKVLNLNHVTKNSRIISKFLNILL